MAEWSNARDLSPLLFGGAGSNPAGVKQYVPYNKLCLPKHWILAATLTLPFMPEPRVQVPVDVLSVV
jgi:hypothetical protein